MPEVGAKSRVESGGGGAGLEDGVWHRVSRSTDVESTRIDERKFWRRGAWGNGTWHVDVEVPVSAVDVELCV